MAIERTLAIIKPDGVQKMVVGEVLRRLEAAKLRIVGLRMTSLDARAAGGFYKVHRERPFFPSLCAYMTSGPVVAVALEGEGAIARLREIMGATDPKKAAAGTIRKDFADSIERNIIHGSDSPESAAYEIPFFFNQVQLQA
ncbi:MAG: nucleoside-diphosphate kinase [Acidobacteriota bacterium]